MESPRICANCSLIEQRLHKIWSFDPLRLCTAFRRRIKRVRPCAVPEKAELSQKRQKNVQSFAPMKKWAHRNGRSAPAGQLKALESTFASLRHLTTPTGTLNAY
ncbi:hypothetical protein [Bradyrhizobium sp. SYSU BS000235]|uniref:hypothetical protein n=1 Tax=Bradyrhizobium sp. SYSU BS000235 TaxID=3411332 RepID=UPI003C7250C9